MDETKELLKASYHRLEGLIGEVKDLRFKIKEMESNVESLRSSQGRKAGGQGNGHAGGEADQSGKADGGQSRGNGQGGGGSGDADARFRRIEERLNYLGEKWLELDEKVFQLERRKR